MKILVTGGAGFVGSHIVDRLIADHHEVVVVDSLASSVDYTPARAKKIICDLSYFTRDMMGIVSADAVVHCAAYPELRHNWDSPAERERLRRSNVDATMALLERMPHVPIVYLSTASVYGSSPLGFIEAGDDMSEDEASPETIESPYAATKFAGEALVAAYAYARGTPWHVLRLVNVVGARTHRGVIVDFVRMMRRSGAIHAADDGKQIKPWVHVLDVADAVAQCLDPSPDGTARLSSARIPSGVYNVTSSELLSWWDIVDEMGVDRAKVTFENRPKGAIGDPHNLRVSGERLAPYFRPRRLVRDGIREALASLGWTR